MARVNFEEKWWTDPRRSKLVKLTGSEEMADGCVAKAWRVAQGFWADGRQPIPFEIFEHLSFSQALVESGLAVVRERSSDVRDLVVYVRGSTDLLGWAAEQSEKNSIAGKKSAEARKAKSGSAQPKKPKKNAEEPENVEHQPNAVRTPANEIEPSDSDSGSNSVSNSLNLSGGVENRPAPDPIKIANKSAWTAYREAYRQTYDVDPIQNKMVNSVVAKFVERVGAIDAPEILKFYLKHSDGQYVKATHPITLALLHAESLRTQWLKGKAITSADVRKFEKRQSKLATLDELRAGRV